MEGKSILYADDDTDILTDKDPDVLENKLQTQSNNSAQWIRDNDMICAGDKTKLMIVSTKQLIDSILTPFFKSLALNV